MTGIATFVATTNQIKLESGDVTMAATVFYGSAKIGRVSTSGEVYCFDHKVGWVNGNGDIYQAGSYVGWISRSGAVLDLQANRIGWVDRSGMVYQGTVAIGRVDSPANRYHTAGAALLLLLGKDIPLHVVRTGARGDSATSSPPASSVTI
jgi:hypothetical protein